MKHLVLIIIILVSILNCSPKIDKLINLKTNWYFQIDKERKGESEGWFKPDYPILFKKMVPVPANWEAFLNEEYDGSAWYFQ